MDPASMERMLLKLREEDEENNKLIKTLESEIEILEDKLSKTHSEHSKGKQQLNQIADSARKLCMSDSFRLETINNYLADEGFVDSALNVNVNI